MSYGRNDIAKTLYYRAVRECPWSKGNNYIKSLLS